MCSCSLNPHTSKLFEEALSMGLLPFFSLLLFASTHCCLSFSHSFLSFFLSPKCYLCIFSVLPLFPLSTLFFCSAVSVCVCVLCMWLPTWQAFCEISVSMLMRASEHPVLVHLCVCFFNFALEAYTYTDRPLKFLNLTRTCSTAH